MIWNQKHLEKHKKAAELLHQIMQETFAYIGKEKNLTESKIEKFIQKKYKENNLKTDRETIIVAFDENSAIPHYYPQTKSKKLKPETFILVDSWARLTEKASPYADITWSAYYGNKLPAKIKKVFESAVGARDYALEFIEKKLKKGKLPIGKDVHQKVNEFIADKGYAKNILHGTGHSIGFRSPHGVETSIGKKGYGKMALNVGYTIEPGIYLPKEFGIRSEIDFFIDDKMKLHVTTPMQQKIVIIKPKK